MSQKKRKLTKNDKHWNSLFEKYQILNEIKKHGHYEISASQINEFRQARLMTKFDHSDNLPELFLKNDLAILPNRRGTYIIGRFKAYENLKMISTKPKLMYLPTYIKSFNVERITSEAVALNVAHASGMIDEVMNNLQNKTGQQSYLTLTGRMSSGHMRYRIKTKGVSSKQYEFLVENSQVEIDGSYENDKSVAIVEAKAKIPKDFMIRQLYYPYRIFHALNLEKEIVPIFFTFADDVFYFTIFEFTDPYDYSSIKWKAQYSFILEHQLNLSISSVYEILQKTQIVYEPQETIFPQADSFERVLDLIDYLVEPKDKFELAEEYEFDVRQSDYYANALVFLGFALKNNNSKFELTSLGKKVQKMYNSNERNKIIIQQILQYKSFRTAFDYVEKHGLNNSRKYISNILYKYIPTINSKSTATRRASTVIGWLRWLYSVVE